MRLANAVVAATLRSPLHRALSGSTDLIRYTGRRTGRVITTPTQYARHGDHIVILVGRPETKSWWRNFTTAADVDVLVARHWLPMTGRAVVGVDDPATAAPLVGAYLDRHPKAARALDATALADQVRSAVLVDCSPR